MPYNVTNSTVKPPLKKFHKKEETLSLNVNNVQKAISKNPEFVKLNSTTVNVTLKNQPIVTSMPMAKLN